MKAMVLEQTGLPLALRELPQPEPAADQVLVQVRACGVCRTDLHIVDGELPSHRLPLIPGHQIVGTVVRTGAAVEGLKAGDRVGIPWLARADLTCRYCRRGQENLCDQALFTGYDLDGGFAEYTLADPRFCLPIPEGYPDLQAAPLLCAGLIGYRALKMAAAAGLVEPGVQPRGEPGTRETGRLGLYGFGSAAHIVLQAARHQGFDVYAFTRPADAAGQAFARRMGAAWAGGSDQAPPEELDAAIIFAPVGGLVPAALRAVARGGTVVCAGIHMSDIPSFPYRILWGERVLRSVANLTRRDGREFLDLAPRVPVRTRVQVYPLERANEALQAVRAGEAEGSVVLAVEPR